MVMIDRRQRSRTLYLRGVSDPLVREAKAVAARRGITLTRLVSEALAETLRARAPKEGKRLDSLKADMAWYHAHKDDLLGRYGGEYAAIMSQKVIDHDKEFGRLAGRIFARFGARPVFMPKIVSGERTVHIPSPRVLRT